MGLGAAATNALWDFMAQREKDRRQAFVDSIAKQGADRADREEARQNTEAQHAHEERLRQLDINERAMTIQEAASKRQEAAAKAETAKREAANTTPGTKLEQTSADTMRAGGLGGLIRVAPANPVAMEQASVNDPALASVDMERQFGGREQTYMGTPHEQETRAFIQRLRTSNDPRDERIATFLEAQMASGDASLPASMVAPDPRLRSQIKSVGGRELLTNMDTGEVIKDLGATTTQAQKVGNLTGVGDSAVGQVMRETMLEQLDTIQKNANAMTTGLVGAATSLIPGTPAYNFKSQATPILGNIAVMVMQDMRKVSKTGSSGFGQLSERELSLLQNALGALDQATTTEQMLTSIQDVRRRVLRVQQLSDEEKARQEAEKAKKDGGPKSVVPVKTAPPAGGAKNYNPATGKVE